MTAHVDALKQLLPLVSYDPQEPVLNAELSAVGYQLDIALTNADGLLNEMHPDTCIQSLADWERVYRLPDLCVSVLQTLEQRRAALISKVRAKAGQSRQYLIDVAISMGYPGATIDEFSLMTCNDDCNSSLNSVDDLFVFQMNLPSADGVFVMDCNSDCISALQSWGDGAIECRIKQIKPAHTTVIFAYP